MNSNRREGTAVEDILQHVRSTYQSLDTPDFSFVKRAVDEERYRGVVQRLQQIFQIEEDTDVNEDVSFGYLLTRGDHQWLLRLSMVGRFAVLFRILPSNGVEVVPSSGKDLISSEQQIAHILSSERIRQMNKHELEQHVPIQLFNVDVDDTRLYQALFTDTDILPWEA